MVRGKRNWWEESGTGEEVEEDGTGEEEDGTGEEEDGTGEEEDGTCESKMEQVRAS